MPRCAGCGSRVSPVIAIDADQLRGARPDLIITQGLCEVCAVTDGEVHRLAAALDAAPRVLSLDCARPRRDLERHRRGRRSPGPGGRGRGAGGSGSEPSSAGFGQPASTGPAARALHRVAGARSISAGHWVPELVTAAGGKDVGAAAGSHSARREWSELRRLRPDHIMVMLCGFGVERARAELDRTAEPRGPRADAPGAHLDHRRQRVHLAARPAGGGRRRADPGGPAATGRPAAIERGSRLGNAEHQSSHARVRTWLTVRQPLRGVRRIAGYRSLLSGLRPGAGDAARRLCAARGPAAAGPWDDGDRRLRGPPAAGAGRLRDEAAVCPAGISALGVGRAAGGAGDP